MLSTSSIRSFRPPSIPLTGGKDGKKNENGKRYENVPQAGSDGMIIERDASNLTEVHKLAKANVRSSLLFFSNERETHEK